MTRAAEAPPARPARRESLATPATPAAATTPAEHSLGARRPGWRVLAESVTGAGHRRTGVPCQDAHASVALPGVALTGGALVAAVADGAGSVPFGGDGARLASQAAVAAAASVAAELATPGSAGAALSEGDDAVVTDDVLRTILVGALASARGARGRGPPRPLRHARSRDDAHRRHRR